MLFRSAEDDAAFSTPEPSATAAPSETAQPSETLQPSETEEPEPTKLPPLVSYEKTKKKLQLKYDDRYTFSKEVRRVETESVTSTKVKTGKKDTKVISVANSNKKKVFAVGCGKAVVELVDGTTYGINVKPAKISLLLLVGQSNMEGSHSDDKSKAEYTNNTILNYADRKSTRLNSSHMPKSRMPSSA